MTSHPLIVVTGKLIDQQSTLSFEEICCATNTTSDWLIQLIEYHIIFPEGSTKTNWQFDALCLKRASLAARFYHDLEINLQGVAVLLDMLEEIETLKNEIARLK